MKKKQKKFLLTFIDIILITFFIILSSYCTLWFFLYECPPIPRVDNERSFALKVSDISADRTNGKGHVPF